MAVIDDRIFGAAKLMIVSAKVDNIAITYNVLYLIASLPNLHNSFIYNTPSYVVFPILTYTVNAEKRKAIREDCSIAKAVFPYPPIF